MAVVCMEEKVACDILRCTLAYSLGSIASIKVWAITSLIGGSRFQSLYKTTGERNNNIIELCD